MLHPLNEGKWATALRQLVSFQREVLAFACSPTTSIPLTKAEVDGVFSKAQDWIWSQLWRYGKPKNGASELQEFLVAVIQFMQICPGERALALEAFDNDIQWTHDLTDATFKFRYESSLTEKARKVVTPLMEAFYTKILDDGIPPEIHGGTGTIKLSDIKDAFWEANPDLRACPACDCQKPDYVHEKDTSEADHFLPKSLYPYLSVHPRNLVPICSVCNQRAKHRRDPIMDHATSPLLSTFHPYDSLTGYPTLTISVCRQTGKGGAPVVEFTDGGASSTPRLESVRYIWNLESRWSDRLNDTIDEIVTALLEIRMSHPCPFNMLEFRNWLQNILHSRSKQIGKQPNRILQVAYLHYVLDTPQELDELLSRLSAG